MLNKRLFKWVFVLIFMLLLSVHNLAQQNFVAPVEVDVWLRVGPGTEWRKLRILPTGTNVAVDGRDLSGAWVRGITQDSEIGWMAARFLVLSDDAVFALPVIEREAPITVDTPPPGSVQSAPAPEAQQAAAQAAQAPIEGGTTATATANVNMRSGPGIDFRRIGGVTLGTAITIDGRDPDVTWVRGINSGGVVGWVSARFISLNFDQVAALPIVDPSAPFGLAAPGDGPTPEAAAVPAPVASTSPVTGFSYGGHVRGLDDFSVNNMRVAGMTWAKYQIRYTQGDNPAGVAGIINDAHAKGFRVLLGVVGLPEQVNNGGYFDSFASYVAGLAALGADALEIWNEQNLSRERPGGQIDPGRYPQLLAASFNAIKSSNPNTLVISGALAPTGFFGGCAFDGCDDGVYLSGMVAAGAANFMDCIGVHYNEGIVPPTQTSGDPRSEFYTRYYPSMVNVYHGAFGGRRPLCFTELGYLTPQGFGTLPPAFAWAQNVTLSRPNG